MHRPFFSPIRRSVWAPGLPGPPSSPTGAAANFCRRWRGRFRLLPGPPPVSCCRGALGAHRAIVPESLRPDHWKCLQKQQPEADARLSPPRRILSTLQLAMRVLRLRGVRTSSPSCKAALQRPAAPAQRAHPARRAAQSPGSGARGAAPGGAGARRRPGAPAVRNSAPTCGTLLRKYVLRAKVKIEDESLRWKGGGGRRG